MALKGVRPETGFHPWDPGTSSFYTQTLQRSPRERGAYVEATPPSHPWLSAARHLTREVLEAHDGKVEGIFAHSDDDVVNVYALINNRVDDFDLSTALALLEVQMSKTLGKEFYVHPTPSWCLAEGDRAAIARGGLSLR